MEKITGNELATGYGFCTADGQSHSEEKGLTIRQHFAAMAMQGILAYPHHPDIDNKSTEQNCRLAVEYADALITALNQPR